jgi:hypothetical protein
LYWHNIIKINILSSGEYTDNASIVPSLLPPLPSKIKLRLVKKYIKKVLKEQKIIDKTKYSYDDEFEDTSSVSELKTMDELINNLPGSVDPHNSPENMNEKLRFDEYPSVVVTEIADTFSLSPHNDNQAGSTIDIEDVVKNIITAVEPGDKKKKLAKKPIKVSKTSKKKKV